MIPTLNITLPVSVNSMTMEQAELASQISHISIFTDGRPVRRGPPYPTSNCFLSHHAQMDYRVAKAQ
jgi:hypothetical protein